MRRLVISALIILMTKRCLMKIIGIDPGTRVVGYGVIESVRGQLLAYAYGAIRTRPQDSLPLRLQKIYRELSVVITNAKPEVAAIEKVFYGKNLQSAIRIGEGRGVAMLAVANAGLECYEYDATKIKKAVVGVGSAHKTQVQAMIKAILQLPETPTPADASDALAIAICHHHLANFFSAPNSTMSS